MQYAIIYQALESGHAYHLMDTKASSYPKDGLVGLAARLIKAFLNDLPDINSDTSLSTYTR
jgi:hypothetical protein